MASSSNTHSAGRRVSSTTENNPTAHTRKRTSRPAPSADTLSERLKHQQLRERQRALRHARTGQDLVMGQASSLAMADPWEAENAIPIFAGKTLPRQLLRAPYRAPRPEALAAVEPGLVDTNVEYIKDCMELRGEQMYAALKNTSILSLHKPHGPQYFPVSARVRITHAHADLPTHLLAVRSSLPGGRDFADDPDVTSPASSLNDPRPSAHYASIHALMLAVYAPLVPELPHSNPLDQLPDSFDTDAESSVDLMLPVVVMRVPSPRTLGMLIAVLYCQRYDNLVKVLLGIPLCPVPASPSDVTSPSQAQTCRNSLSQSSLFTQSIFTQLFAPLADLPPPAFSNNTPSASAVRHARLTTRFSNMSRLLALGYLNSPSSEKDLRNDTGVGGANAAAAAAGILYRTRLVQALAANARTLGVCDLAFWGAIDVAWAVLLGALGFIAGSGSVSLSLNPALAEEEEGDMDESPA